MSSVTILDLRVHCHSDSILSQQDAVYIRIIERLFDVLTREYNQQYQHYNNTTSQNNYDKNTFVQYWTSLLWRLPPAIFLSFPGFHQPKLLKKARGKNQTLTGTAQFFWICFLLLEILPLLSGIINTFSLFSNPILSFLIFFSFQTFLVKYFTLFWSMFKLLTPKSLSKIFNTFSHLFAECIFLCCCFKSCQDKKLFLICWLHTRR